jgi:hypothetical protein
VKSTKSLAQQGIATGGDVVGENVFQIIATATPSVSNKLTRKERIDLHKRVERTAVARGMAPKELWITLHHLARVTSVEEMTESHLPTLNTVLDLMDENAELRNSLPDDDEKTILKTYRMSSEEERNIIFNILQQFPAAD